MVTVSLLPNTGVMATSEEVLRLRLGSSQGKGPEEDRDTQTLLEVVHGGRREKIVLQRLIVIARIPHHLADRTDLGAHYEKLSFHTSRQFAWDQMTGLLLIYPSCALHVVESSREVLRSVLRDMEDMQQSHSSPLLEAPKVLFLAHQPQRRLFQQWSYKVIDTDLTGGSMSEEEEESTETMLCTVLSALQRLGEHLDASQRALPGAVLDQTPDLIISEELLVKLCSRDDLLTAQQHLQMYKSPVNISMNFGHVIRNSFPTIV